MTAGIRSTIWANRGEVVAHPPGSRQDSAMLTWLRIVVSCFCLVLCFLFAGLLVSSYYRHDYLLHHEPPLAHNQMILVAANGVVGFQRLTSQPVVYGRKGWEWAIDPVRQRPHRPVIPIKPALIAFRWSHITNKNGPGHTILQLPIWFLALTTALIAYGAKPKPRWRIGLRELFVLSTIGAITVGTIAAVLRAISTTS